MRARALPRLVPLALLATVAPAQDAWGEYQRALAARRREDSKWTLFLTRGSTFPSDDDFMRLLSAKDFDAEHLPPEVAQALWTARGWREGEHHWLLTSPTGTVLLEGAGNPSSAAILERMRAEGFSPSWERRAIFLREHPDHGEARWEDVEQAFLTVGGRFFKLQSEGKYPPEKEVSPYDLPVFRGRFGTDPESQAQGAYALKGMAEALEAYAKVPGWQEDGMHLFILGLMLAAWDTAPDSHLQQVLRRIHSELMAWMAQHPEDPLTRATLLLIGAPLGMDPHEGAVIGLHPNTNFSPVSTRARFGINALGNHQGWPVALAFLDGLPIPEPEPGMSAKAWEEFRSGRMTFHLERMGILLRLERWEEAEDALKEARMWAGALWKERIPQARRAMRAAPPEVKSRFEPLLNAPPLPDLPAPPTRPLPRLALVGHPAWTEAWHRLKAHPAFQDWEASELQWERLEEANAAALAQGQGWGPEARWVLRVGDQVQASGTELPEPKTLAGKLQALAPGRLHRLGHAIQANPLNLDLRKERAECLLARGPRGEAEAMAAEDARLGRASLAFPPGWTPSPEVWPWHAQKLLPELEQELRAWPSRVATWRLWLQWARLHPSRPSPLALARSLALWGSEPTWSARLPKEVHLAVAAELRTSGRFEEMRAWFQEAWEGLGGSTAQTGLVPIRFQGDPAKRLQDIGEAILSPLREALVALRRDREVVALDAAFAGLKGQHRRGESREVPR